MNIQWLLYILILRLSYAVPDYKLIFMDKIPSFSEDETRDRVSSSCEDLETLIETETRVFDLVQKSCDQMQKIVEAKKLVKSLQKLLLKRPQDVE